MHDPLSGLPNRALLLQRVEAALADRGDSDVGVLFLDLDDFKVVNDSLGHATGDRLIVAVAERLRACFSGQFERDGQRAPTIARLGGDEFTVLLPRITGEESAVRIAERVAHELSAPFELGVHEVVARASIGIALSSAGPDNASDLLRAADVAMYRAKAAGAETCVVYDPGMGRHAAERLGLEMDLRRAIERGGLTVHYQPIVDIASGAVRGFEALVRWVHPERGIMSPAAFIPLAEETGLIVPLGKWVLEKACRQMQAWRRAEPTCADFVISVNLSTRQLQQRTFVDSVAETLRRTELPPACLELEITESVLMRDADASTIDRLADIGVHLAIDDFGTGYSSLAYLSRLRIDTLKIDRSFVARLGRDHESTAVVRAILGLAHTLNLNVTAEGIEQPEQAQALLALGCRRGQGYLWARPLPADEVDFSGGSTARAA
jgi:Amt family ammonium transporter